MYVSEVSSQVFVQGVSPVVEFNLIITQQDCDAEGKILLPRLGDSLLGHTLRKKFTWPTLPHVGELVHYHYMMRPALVEFVVHDFLKNSITVQLSVISEDFKSLLTDLVFIEGWKEHDMRGAVHRKE